MDIVGGEEQPERPFSNKNVDCNVGALFINFKARPKAEFCDKKGAKENERCLSSSGKALVAGGCLGQRSLQIMLLKEGNPSVCPKAVTEYDVNVLGDVFSNRVVGF